MEKTESPKGERAVKPVISLHSEKKSEQRDKGDQEERRGSQKERDQSSL